MNIKLFKKRYIMLLIFIGLCAFWVAGPLDVVQAGSGPGSSSELRSETNSDCLKCHATPDWDMTLPNGDTLQLTFDETSYKQSVHGEMMCLDCHSGYQLFPHPKMTADNARDYSLTFHDTCKQCHSDQFDQVRDSVHEELLQTGNTNTPLCVDCHQPHAQSYMKDMVETAGEGVYSWTSQICENCHQDQFESYTMSVHGEALLAGGNEDLPGCVDCHNIHEISNPMQAKFRKDSVDMCAKCHTDSGIMEKYGLETNVLDTYVVFHDTTVTLLEDYNPDSLTNKPTCYDCHGIHDVGIMTPPQIVSDMPGAATYPTVEKAAVVPPIENVGITSALLGLLVGSVGTLTIRQLIKEKKDEDEPPSQNGEES